MSAGKFLAGFIEGGVVGAITGLLLAPKSGEETRAMIAKTSSEIYDKTEDSLKEIKEKAQDVVGDLQKKGDELIAKVQSMLKKENTEEA